MRGMEENRQVSSSRSRRDVTPNDEESSCNIPGVFVQTSGQKKLYFRNITLTNLTDSKSDSLENSTQSLTITGSGGKNGSSITLT